MDLVIGLALGDETPETYRTLQSNLEKAHFEQREPSFRWARDVEAVTLLNYKGGPSAAGSAAAASSVAHHPQVAEALSLLEERFCDAGQDGPNAHGLFLASPDDDTEKARLRQEAVATVREFLRGFHERG
ncbi:MAG TPA: hypothetical protein VFE45_08235 [Coriobacteriia bacterium]|nr:hypothetical protein [Coriobacteriia bacterium]